MNIQDFMDTHQLLIKKNTIDVLDKNNNFVDSVSFNDLSQCFNLDGLFNSHPVMADDSLVRGYIKKPSGVHCIMLEIPPKVWPLTYSSYELCLREDARTGTDIDDYITELKSKRIFRLALPYIQFICSMKRDKHNPDKWIKNNDVYLFMSTSPVKHITRTIPNHAIINNVDDACGALCFGGATMVVDPSLQDPINIAINIFQNFMLSTFNNHYRAKIPALFLDNSPQFSYDMHFYLNKNKFHILEEWELRSLEDPSFILGVDLSQTTYSSFMEVMDIDGYFG